MLDLIIRGGRVVTPQDVGEYDIAIQGEHIVSVTVPGVLTQEAQRVIDAKGKVVVPGGVEAHAHVKLRMHPFERYSQGYEGTSRACAFGGTTTILDFAVANQSSDPLKALAEKKKEWQGNTYIDYIFHVTLTSDPPPEYLEQIPELIQEGQSSIKCFTRGRRPFRDPPIQMEDGYLLEIMSIVARHGGIVAVHAENEFMNTFNQQKLKREGRTGYENLPLAYTNVSEDTAFRNVIRIAEHAGVALYLVHVTAKEGVAAIAEARSRGLPVYGEVSHSFLVFTSENYKEPNGVKYHTYPGMKYPADRDALRAAIFDGRLSTLATDEVTTTKDIKLMGKTVFDAIGGHSGCETRLPFMFSEGVSKGSISLKRFVDVTSADAAKILGMYPKKGAIAPGSDADIVIIDPNIRKNLKLPDLHGDTDYSIWEGWDFHGWPIMTLLRGKVIVENGKLLGSLSDGKYVPRKVAPEVLKGPAC